MNSIIESFIGVPFLATLLKRECLLFTAGENGAVEWIFSADGHYYTHVIKRLKGRNVRDFFRLDRKKTLLEQADPRRLSAGDIQAGFSLHPYLYESKNILENIHETCDFYSTLVYSTLYLKALRKEKKLLGVINFRNHIPFYLFEQILQNPVILIDGQGRICGINGSFIKHFREMAHDPEAALNRQAGDFLSGNPVSLFQKKLRGLQSVKALDWREHVRVPLESRPRAGLLETAGIGECSFRKGEGMHWSNLKGPGEDFLTVLSDIDMECFDVRVAFRARRLKGFFPNCILGGDRFGQTSLFPDYRGYSLGFLPGDRIMFKKRGYFRHVEPPPAGLEEECDLEAVKCGNELYFSCGRGAEAGFFDDTPLVNTGKQVSLYLRPASGVILRDLAVYLRKKDDAAEGSVEVTLLNGAENAFKAHSLLTQLFTPEGSLVYAYFLEDISAFKQRIVNLEKENVREREEKERLKSMLKEKEEEHAFFIGESKAVNDIKQKAKMVAETRSTVLVEGETGTGKEVLANYIHRHGLFSSGPFIKVDCAALPPGLIESELFGHKKGSFTGALSDKKGKFELADKGTLFLDEIGNISPDMQAKLLGFLQDFTVQAVGGMKPVRLELRVLCATNRNLLDLVKQGLFREDLFYRLNVVKFILPPLRDRREDIPSLALFFLREFSRELNAFARTFSPAAFKKLCGHSWPGNVRELRSVVQKAVIFSKDPVIQEESVEIESEAADRRGGEGRVRQKGLVNVRKITREDLLKYLSENEGTVYRTAQKLGVNRKTLYNKIEKFKIDLNDLRKATAPGPA